MTYFLRDHVRKQVYGFYRLGLKTVVVNDIFWFERGSGFEEPDGASKQRIPRSFPWGQPGKPTSNIISLSLSTEKSTAFSADECFSCKLPQNGGFSLQT